MIRIKLKGITFYSGTFDQIYDKFENSTVLVAPAASALADIDVKKKYHLSLKKADIAILDSGFFCILLKILKRVNVQKFSGYLFLELFLTKAAKHNKILLINPTKKSNYLNSRLLKKKGFKNILGYTAPLYKKNLVDLDLIKLVNNYKPRYVIINIGGGTQEILAQYLKENIKKRKINILCTGAAIAFMTGEQAPINKIVDKFYLGWLVRLLHNPREYFIRTILSFKLLKYFFKGCIKIYK